MPNPKIKTTPPPSPMAGPVAAMNKLITEREAYAKAHGGRYPSDEELMKSRKKAGMR